MQTLVGSGRLANFLRPRRILPYSRHVSNSSKLENKMPTVKHVVMFSLKDGSTEAEMNKVKSGLLELPKQIPVITSFELGSDLVLAGSADHPAGKNRQICWSASCASIDDYETYDQHEAHKSFLKDTLAPVVQQGSRAAIQYTVD